MDRGSGVVVYHVHDPNIPFVRSDLLHFAKVHQRVLLFTEREPHYSLPANVELVSTSLDWTRYRPVALLLRYGMVMLGIWVGEMLAVRRWMPFLASMKKLISNIFRAKEVHIACTERGAFDALHYSFWWYDCLFLAWLRRREGVRQAVTRTHGGDLYEERGSLAVATLFRNYQLGGLDAVYSVSEGGTRYLQERYPSHRDRFHTSYLGTADHGVAPMPCSMDTLVIVSCARVRNVKRVHLIGQALELVEGISARWVHFGGTARSERDPAVAQFMRSVDRLRQRPNIEVELMGHMENDAIMDWYRHHPVHCFVSMSSTEGIPVSMMEAISFGIPVLSTDVGGCREIVNERTGMLIPLDTSVEEVARIIEGFGQTRFVTSETRAEVRGYWQEKFNAERNYREFFDGIER